MKLFEKEENILKLSFPFFVALLLIILPIWLIFKDIHLSSLKTQVFEGDKGGVVEIQLPSKWDKDEIVDQLILYRQGIDTELSDQLINDIELKKKESIALLKKRYKSKSDYLINLKDSNGNEISNLLLKKIASKNNVGLVGQAKAESSAADNFLFDSSVNQSTKDLLFSAYQRLNDLYGARFMAEENNKIRVKVVSDESENCYDSSTNTIDLTNSVQEKEIAFVITHELAHAFHGPVINFLSPTWEWEEGFAEAISFMIFLDKKNINILNDLYPNHEPIGLGQDFDGLRTLKGFYESEILNVPTRFEHDPYIWHSMVIVKFALKYQTSGNFFIDFNKKIYEDYIHAINLKQNNNRSLKNKYDTSRIINQFTKMVPIIEGISAEEWLRTKIYLTLFKDYDDNNDTGYLVPKSGLPLLSTDTALIYDPISETDKPVIEIYTYQNESLGKLDLNEADSSSVKENKTTIEGIESTFTINIGALIDPKNMDKYTNYTGVLKFVLNNRSIIYLPKIKAAGSNSTPTIYGIILGAFDGDQVSIVRDNDSSVQYSTTVTNGFYQVSGQRLLDSGEYSISINHKLLALNNNRPQEKIESKTYKTLKIDSSLHFTATNLLPVNCCSKFEKIEEEYHIIPECQSGCASILSLDDASLFASTGDINVTKKTNFAKEYELYSSTIPCVKVIRLGAYNYSRSSCLKMP